MRVLFINSRPDAEQHPGGDNIQMLQTKYALEKMGVSVLICSPENISAWPVCDIAHVFNIQEPEATWMVFQVLQDKYIPIVLSPIYWDMYEYWCELAIQSRARWRQLSRWMGAGRVKWLYLNWQRIKAPINSRWKLQRRLLAQAQCVLPNSKTEGILLEKSFSLGRKFQQRVDVVPNGIDPRYYISKPQPSDWFLQEYGLHDFVLQVGTINPVKNQLGLIESSYQLSVPLVFVGQVLSEYSEYGELCKTRAHERGNVIFIDQIPHEELPGIYALAAVHALPSWRETPGLVSLEAGAAGCRVVTTSIGSTRDYFGDLVWYCYPSNHNSIRTAVEDALRAIPSPELRDRVLNKFTWQRAAEETFASYNKILNKN